MKKPRLSSLQLEDELVADTLERLETNDDLVAYLNYIQRKLPFHVS